MIASCGVPRARSIVHRARPSVKEQGSRLSDFVAPSIPPQPADTLGWFEVRFICHVPHVLAAHSAIVLRRLVIIAQCRPWCLDGSAGVRTNSIAHLPFPWCRRQLRPDQPPTIGQRRCGFD
jgi:hypothetical protein